MQPPGIPVSIVSPKEEEGGCNLQLFVCHANVWLKQMSWLKRHLHFMRPEEIHYTTATARKPLLLSLSLSLAPSISYSNSVCLSYSISFFVDRYLSLTFISFLSVLLNLFCLSYSFFLSSYLTITLHLLPSLTFLNFDRLEQIKIYSCEDLLPLKSYHGLEIK